MEPRGLRENHKSNMNMHLKMLKNTMPCVVLTQSGENCMLADLVWSESTLVRKTCVIFAAPVTKSQTLAESRRKQANGIRL